MVRMADWRQRRWPAARWWGWVLLPAVALLALGPVVVSPLASMEHMLYDLRLRALAPRQPDAQIAVIDVDERALALHGRWPWPRGQLANLLEQAITREGAILVGLDLVLAEADQSSGLAALDRLRQGPLAGDGDLQRALQALRPSLDDDGRLAALLQQRPVVLGFHLSNEDGAARIGVLPPALLPVELLPGAAQLLDWKGHGGNLLRLQQATRLGAGHLNAVLDDDGMVRRLPLLVQHQQGVQPTLAVAMARVLLAGAPGSARPAPLTGVQAAPLAALSFEPADGPWRALRLGQGSHQLRVPMDAQGLALVPYARAGPARISAADVLAGTVPHDALRGKAVLVGVSAPGLIDQRRTPMDEAMLGTLVHAHMLSGMLQGRVLAVPAAAPWLAVLLLSLAGAVLQWGLPRCRLWQGALLTVAVVLAGLALNLLAWVRLGWVLPLAGTLLLPPLLTALHLGLAYRRATGARQRLAQLFGQYVPPELVREMARQPERHTMGSRSAELTVLFADVSGFSAVAERMPPAELGAMMNLLFSHLTDVVRDHRGTLDKYIGDSVMAFWGAPLDDPAHARHAVQAAHAMLARLPAIHAEMATHGWPALQLHIGINTGTMVVGDMGSRHRRAYTVLGDAVNLAARLQGFSSRYALGLVVGDATRAALGDQPCLPLGMVNVRGRDGGLPAWQPLPPTLASAAVPALQQTWAQLQQARRAGRTEEASSLLDSLQHEPALAMLCRWQRLTLGPEEPSQTPGHIG